MTIVLTHSWRANIESRELWAFSRPEILDWNLFSLSFKNLQKLQITGGEIHDLTPLSFFMNFELIFRFRNFHCPHPGDLAWFCMMENLGQNLYGIWPMKCLNKWIEAFKLCLTFGTKRSQSQTKEDSIIPFISEKTFRVHPHTFYCLFTDIWLKRCSKDEVLPVLYMLRNVYSLLCITSYRKVFSIAFSL